MDTAANTTGATEMNSNFAAVRTLSGNFTHLAFKGQRSTFCGAQVTSTTDQSLATVDCDRCCKPGKGVRAGA